MKKEVKWVLMIAAGVVLGLLVWTVGGVVLRSWQQNQKQEREGQQEKEAKSRAEDIRKSVETDFAWQHVWIDILAKARDGAGTLRERIQRQPKYQERLRAVGKVKILEEERTSITTQLDFYRRNPDPDSPSQSRWEDELRSRLDAIKVELASSR